MQQFEWSESGLKLLNIINGIISREGGRQSLAVKIIREDSEYYKAIISQQRKGNAIKRYAVDVKSARDQLIIKHWNTHSLLEISEIIQVKCLSTISRRGYSLGLPKRWNVFQKPGKCTPVTVHYPTGDAIYNSVTEAARVLRVKPSNIHRAIKKNHKVRGYKVSE